MSGCCCTGACRITGRCSTIPLSDWPAVKQAIAELNEHYKEKDMKEDRYEFDSSEYDWTWSMPDHAGSAKKLTVTRKKPKVKVEWQLCGHTWSSGAVYSREPCGNYYLVQFRVTGNLNSEYVYSYRDKGLMALLTPNCTVSSFNLREPVNATDVLHIATDAHSKWSTPVLLPEQVYKRLDEITKALEEKANEVKG